MCGGSQNFATAVIPQLKTVFQEEHDRSCYVGIDILVVNGTVQLHKESYIRNLQTIHVESSHATNRMYPSVKLEWSNLGQRTKKTETYLISKGRPRTNSSEITGPMLLQTYRSIADYRKNSKYEMSIQTGDVVEIVEKHENGWWFCQMEGRRGWLPAAFLEPLDSPDEIEEQEPNYEGERYKVIRSYMAVQEDEMSLEENDVVDVIHKLLDGWWVVRKFEATGYYPSMYLQKSGYTLNSGFNVNKVKSPPPRRSTIRNAKSIHGTERKRISQETYRRNSRRHLQQRVNTSDAANNKNVWKQKVDPRTERKLQFADAISEEEGSQKMSPEIPPRPTLSEIMAHCSERTKSKIK
ncbi:neutrophil cytosol factor 1 isoform X2 [Mobula birostris]|uniref:neutrophil cytosol factor 1 isoform X2 n=1 Tax=Mobula birostris TaxID=1983395 RepID=UPI003B285A15